MDSYSTVILTTVSEESRSDNLLQYYLRPYILTTSFISWILRLDFESDKYHRDEIFARQLLKWVCYDFTRLVCIHANPTAREAKKVKKETRHLFQHCTSVRSKKNACSATSYSCKEFTILANDHRSTSRTNSGIKNDETDVDNESALLSIMIRLRSFKKWNRQIILTCTSSVSLIDRDRETNHTSHITEGTDIDPHTSTVRHVRV